MFNIIIPARANAPPALEGSVMPLPALGVLDQGFQALLEAAAALAAGAAHSPAARTGEGEPVNGHLLDDHPAESTAGKAGETETEEEPDDRRTLPDPALAGLAALYAVPAVQKNGMSKVAVASTDETSVALEISDSQPAQAGEPIPAREPVADRQPAEAPQPGTARQPAASQPQTYNADPAPRTDGAPERDAVHPAAAEKERPAVQTELGDPGEVRGGRARNLSGLPRNQNPSGAEKTGQVSVEAERQVGSGQEALAEQAATREAVVGGRENLSGLPQSQEPSGAQKTGQVLGERETRVNEGKEVQAEQAVSRETVVGHRENLSGLPRSQEPSGAQKTGQVLDERGTRVNLGTEGHLDKPRVTAATVVMQAAAEDRPQNGADRVQTQNPSGAEKTGQAAGEVGRQVVAGQEANEIQTVSGAVEPRSAPVLGTSSNPIGAAALAGPGQVEQTQSAGMDRAVRGAKVSVSREAGQEAAVRHAAAVRQAARKAGATEASRSELPTFGPELVPPQISELAEGEVRTTTASSQPIGHNVDEKMIGFVRQVGQRIESLVRSDKTSLEVQLVPEQMGKIDLKLVSSPQGTSVVIQAENASTGWLIEQNLHQLRQSLTEAGVQLNGLSVGGNSTHDPGSQGHPGSFRGLKPGYPSSAGGSGRIVSGPKRYEWVEPGSQRVNYLV